jgi:hypothetical protein
VESEPSHGVGATRVCPASIFDFLDFLREPPVIVGFYRGGFHNEVAREQDCRVDEPSAQDFRAHCGAMTAEARANPQTSHYRNSSEDSKLENTHNRIISFEPILKQVAIGPQAKIRNWRTRTTSGT